INSGSASARSTDGTKRPSQRNGDHGRSYKPPWRDREGSHWSPPGAARRSSGTPTPSFETTRRKFGTRRPKSWNDCERTPANSAERRHTSKSTTFGPSRTSPNREDRRNRDG